MCSGVLVVHHKHVWRRHVAPTLNGPRATGNGPSLSSPARTCAQARGDSRDGCAWGALLRARAVTPALLVETDNRDMVHSRLQKTGFAGAAAASALLIATWGTPAQADPGGGGAFKIVGASYTQELKFADCMRRHGEPGFPDPSSNGVFSLNGIDPNSPQYEGARKQTCGPGRPPRRGQGGRQVLAADKQGAPC